MAATKLQMLLDRAEINDVVIRYALGMDLQDWELFRSCLTDEVEADYSEATGQPAAMMRVQDFVAFVRGILSTNGLRTQTLSTNHATTVEGDSATCNSYYIAQHYLPNADGSGRVFNVHGWYTDTLVRTAQGWKICKVKVTVRWATGNPKILGLST